MGGVATGMGAGASERQLYLVRHGETEGESSIRFFGRTDVPLSALGREQARQVAGLMQHVRFSAVVHSPLARARESAEIIIALLNQPPDLVEEAPDLREVDFGEMEGMTEGEIARALPDWFREWKAGRATAYPEGESFQAFAQRVASAFDGLLARHPRGNLLVVVHKGVIRRGLAHLLGLSAEAATKINLDLGSLSVVACNYTASEPHTLKHLNWTPGPDRDRSSP